ncbi:hypothetical protein MPLDJ20_110435 [Mesorhizobium plurifarium]|uniref:Uncharacterized protein n=1 Tax=Mesorhizobium plurifarium TaxID=69974 RepID=A0A090DYN9_MESPL|nr:hypothetical protein MPLDJ20_110435 [Mesorhizobium plurifarium]
MALCESDKVMAGSSGKAILMRAFVLAQDCGARPSFNAIFPAALIFFAFCGELFRRLPVLSLLSAVREQSRKVTAKRRLPCVKAREAFFVVQRS